MNTQTHLEQTLVEKIRSLPAEKMAEVEDFVDFLLARTEHSRLVRTAAKLSEEAFRLVWDNPDDADYDSTHIAHFCLNI